MAQCTAGGRVGVAKLARGLSCGPSQPFAFNRPTSRKGKWPTGTFPAIAYHYLMRRFTFVLMIALLLLRGWMGEAMATGMALAPLQSPPSATQTVAAHTHQISAQAHFDHATAEPEAFYEAQAVHDCTGCPASEDPSHAGPAHCDACAACQACQAVALSPLAPSTASISISPALPRSSATQFASAVAALGQKPPIS